MLKALAFLSEFMFMLGLPIIFSFLNTLKILWRKCPLSVTALVWMAVVAMLGSVYRILYFGEVNPFRLFSVMSPVISVLLLLYVERLRKNDEKN